MPRKPKSTPSDAPLAPVPSEILDQVVGQGSLSHQELDAAVRRSAPQRQPQPRGSSRRSAAG